MILKNNSAKSLTLTNPLYSSYRLSVQWSFHSLILAAVIFMAQIPTGPMAWAGGGPNRVYASSESPDLQPESPESAYTQDRNRMISAFSSPDDPGLNHLPTIDFCSEWNPEFSFNGHRCCRSLAATHGRKNRMSCFSRHKNGGFCEEVTAQERDYISKQEAGQGGDVLEMINHDLGHRDQAYCTANNGFLAYGRPLVPSDKNRVILRDPTRCTQFGTDSMVGMIEWLGRQVATEYPAPDYERTRLLVGDIAAPRGGCLSGRSGGGHLSHTNGEDADIGLLNVRKNGPSPAAFSNDFDPKTNWWMIKKILKNPYACVKVIFLDKRHIRKLSKVVWKDEDWPAYRRYLRHQKGHRNHMHVRIGDHPGPPGCTPGANPELEEDQVDSEVDEAGTIDAVGHSMSAPVLEEKN